MSFSHFSAVIFQRQLVVFREALVLFVVVFAGMTGCRREAPPSFSPGPEVQELTKDLEDAEEIAIYEGLQRQIADVLRKTSGTPENPIALEEEETSDHLKLGYSVYAHYCTQCHGVSGDGNGPAAPYLNPKPRNYTHGVFKFTSTPYGKKPRRADLIRTVRRGVTGTSMPAFDRLSDQEVDAVVDYVLALSQRGELERELAMIAYEDEELPDEEGIQEIIKELLSPWQDSSDQIVMPVTQMPPMTDKSVLAGHQLFLEHACNKCHGKYGRGGTMENVEVGVDTWGNKAAAADLSSGMFRGGERPIDIYRRIYSGINGTPMPAFEKLFQDNPDAIWQLVHFIKSTGERRRQGKPPLSEADLPEASMSEKSTDAPTESETKSSGESA